MGRAGGPRDTTTQPCTFPCIHARVHALLELTSRRETPKRIQTRRSEEEWLEWWRARAGSQAEDRERAREREGGECHKRE